jgi:hypothetical protein
MIRLAVLLMAVSSGTCLSGRFTGSWSIAQFLSEPHPALSDRFGVMRLGVSLDVTPGTEVLLRGGYGETMPSVLPEPTPPENVFDGTGRLWIIEAGADRSILGDGFFFVRGTAGYASVLKDYCIGNTSTYLKRRFTERFSEPFYSIGVGSRFSVDFIPLVSLIEFLLSVEGIGQYGLVSGAISIAI